MSEAPTVIGSKEILSPEDRPADGERVMYLFEPFNRWYVGKYDAESDSVIGKNGFTSWLPEVIGWMKDETGDSPYDQHLKEKA